MGKESWAVIELFLTSEIDGLADLSASSSACPLEDAVTKNPDPEGQEGDTDQCQYSLLGKHFIVLSPFSLIRLVLEEKEALRMV